jgi:hypothetical protein
MASKEQTFKFRKHDRIGAVDALDDSDFLHDCFVDNPGIYDCLHDTNRHERIILGRTGAGKTALIEILKKNKERVRVIEPENLSLSYLSNSSILRYLEQQNIYLDLFYKLLWKHIFLVEIVSLKFNSQGALKDWFNKNFGTKAEKTALKYLKDWNNSFFLMLEKRVIEIENKLSKDIAQSIGTETEILKAKLSGSIEMSETEKKVFQMKAQEVVNKLQIQDLNLAIEEISKDLFSKEEPKFYLVIDKLDENWVDSSVRYQLIRALFDVVREFSHKFKPVKIVLAMREDLLHSVFSQVKKDGLQEQKYNPFYLKLKWTQKELMQILDKRLQKLAIKKGFSANFPVRKLYAEAVDSEAFSIYFAKRTLYAPRDVVDFFNLCIEYADGKEKIGPQIIKTAEGQYSKARIIALYEEWRAIYPNLKIAVETLKNFPKSFRLKELQKAHCDEMAFRVLESQTPDDFVKILNPYFENQQDLEFTVKKIIHIFYKVGLVGVKLDTFQSTSWSFVDSAVIGISDLNSETKIEICPAFFRVLGIKSND